MIISAHLSRAVAAAVLFMGITTTLSCGGATETAPAQVVTGIVVSPDAPTLQRLGQTVGLSASVYGKFGPIAGVSLSWSSDAPSVVEISGSGNTAIATARAPGSAHIVASAGGVTGNTTIVVSLIPVAAVTLGDHAIGVAVGATKQLTAQARDATGGLISDRAPTWSAVNPSIASVSTAGLVTGVSPGTGKIVAMLEGKADTALVTVTPAPVINLSSAALTFTGMQGGADPSSQTVTITNVGGNALNDLSVGAITYGGGATGWLQTHSLSSEAANPSATLTIQPSMGTLAPGTYTATVPVQSSVANNSPQNVSVTLVVAAGPTIALSSSSLTFSATERGANPATQSVTITNSGNGTLSGLTVGAIAYGQGSTGWLQATLSGGTASPSATLTIQATTAGLAAGSYSATIPITSNAAVNSPRTITVTFTIAAAPPSISLSTTTLSFTTTTGSNPAPQGVTISNGGGGTLTGLSLGVAYGPGASGWLQALNLSATTATPTASFTVQPVAGALTAGTYTATISVLSGVAVNSPQIINVTFTIAAPSPLIGLSTSALAFSSPMCDYAPPAASATITNAGVGVLSGLSATWSSATAPWITSASLSSTTANPSATLTIGVDPRNLVTGTYSGSISVLSSVAPNSPRTVAITYTIGSRAPGPFLGGVDDVSYSIPQGGPVWDGPTQWAENEDATDHGSSLAQCKLQGLTLGATTYTSGTPGWLSITFVGDGAAATLRTAANVAGLSVGSYSATFPLIASNAVNSPRNVTVTLNVTPPTAPVAFTESATGVTSTAATLNGSTDRSKTLPSNVYFQWGTTTSLGSQTSSAAANAPCLGCSPGWNIGLTGLLPHTTYYYRVVASNAYGTSTGAIVSFVTP